MQCHPGDRLKAAAALVAKGVVAADIGTDHALLAVYLIEQGICSRVIASDRASGPYRHALETVENWSLADRIEVRLGDGLDVLAPGEVDTLLLLGMGGALICDILSKRPDILATTRHLVLQPQKKARELRQWLAHHGWRIVAEDLIKEGSLYYPLLAAEPGTMSLTELEAEFGPCLLHDRHPVLADYLLKNKKEISAIRRQIESSAGSLANSRLQELNQMSILLDKACDLLAD